MPKNFLRDDPSPQSFPNSHSNPSIPYVDPIKESKEEVPSKDFDEILDQEIDSI